MLKAFELMDACVRILLYVSSYYYISIFLILLDLCPHACLNLSLCAAVCVLPCVREPVS